MAVSARELTLILRVQSAGSNNIRRMAADLNSLERGGQSFAQRFKTASQSIGAVGRQMQLIGGIGTFALGLAANQAANLQTQVTLAATQVTRSVGGVRRQATKDFQGILDQMTKFPTSADDMTKALYDLYSTLNITGKQGIPMLQQLNKAAVAGGLTAQEAGQGLLTVMSNFPNIQQNARGATQAFTRMFAAVRYGRMTMAELSTVLQSAAPAARQSNQSFNTLAGTLAFLSRSLGPAKAAVGFARLEEILAGPQMTEGLQKFGVSLKDANGRMLPFQQQIAILIKRFPELTRHGAAVGNFFKTIGGLQGTIQARRAFSTIVGNVSGFRDIMRKTIGDNNEFTKSYTAMAQTLGVQWGVFLNTLKEIVITVGASVIPAFLEMAKPLREVVAWFQKLPQSTRDMIGRFLAFAAVGTLVIGTLAAIAAGIGVVVASLPELGGALAIIVGGAATYTFLAVIGKKIYDNWKELGPLFKNLFNDIKNVLINLGEAIMAFYHGNWDQVWSHLGDAIKAAVPGVKDALNLIMQAVIQWGRSFVTTTQGIVTGVLAGMFAVSKFRGRGGGAGRLLSGLSNADLMSPFLGAAGGPMGMAITAASKSDDLEKLAKYVPFMNTQQQLAYKELSTRQKIASSWRTQVTAMSEARTASKQIAALDELHARGLTASSVVRTGETLVQRTPRMGFASAAERASALEILNRAPAAAGAGEKAMAALNVATMAVAGSAANAGKGLLSFFGFGNPWIGGAILGAGAIYGLKTALDSVFTSTTTKVNEEYKSVQSMKQTAAAARQAAQNYVQYSTQARTLSKAISDTKNRLGSEKGGTLAYQSDLKTLAQLQDQLKQATEGATKAQADQASTMQSALQAINPKNINDSLSVLKTVREGAPLGAATYGNFQNLNLRGTSKAGVDVGTYNRAKATVTGLTTAFSDNVQTMLLMAASGQKVSGSEKQMMTQMSHVASQYKTELPGLSTLMQDLTGQVLSAVKAMGRVPTNMRGFAAYANSIPQAIRPAAQLFMQLTHQAPNVPFLQMLSRIEQQVPGASKVMAAFVATQGKLPSHKQYNFLFHRPAWAEAWMARFIQLHHRLPSRKEVNIYVHAHDDASQKIAQIEKHIGQLQRNAHQVMRVGGTNPYATQIQQAQNQMNKLKAPHLKGIMRFTIQGDAFGKFPRQAAAAEQGAAAAFNPLSKHVAGLGTSAGTGFAANFSAQAHATAHATISVIVNQYRKTMKASSPSKLFKDRVGDPMLQGILAGLKDKASIQQGAQTAVQTMVDAFSSFKDTFKTQMGDLFAGPTFVPAWEQSFGSSLQQTLDFGGKVTFKELRSNLSSQVRTFQHYQSMLRRLQRRGASVSLINALTQLGPEATPEVQGLLGGTRKQLREYNKLYARSQKDINSAATRATKNQYKEWRKQGAAVALGFMQGMTDHKASLARFFERIFNDLLNQVKHQHKSHSPSRVYMQEGVNVMRGFQLGVMRQANDNVRLANYFAPPVRGLRHRGPQVASVTNNYYYNRTYNVYPSKDESLLSALRKHDHITRHRP